MSSQKYTVIGYYPDTGHRFTNTVAADSPEAAEEQTLREDASGILIVVATVLGEVAVDAQVRVRTVEDLDPFGTELICRDGGEHMPDYQTVTHEAGEGNVLDVCCVKCGRSGSFVISVDGINW